MKKLLLALGFLTAFSAIFAENLLPDPELIHGKNGLFCGDGNERYFAPVRQEGNTLSVTLDGIHFTAVFLPEVPFLPKSDYVFRFTGKASRPVRIMLSEYVTRANGSHGVKSFRLTKEFQTFEYRFNTDAVPPWGGRRFKPDDKERFGGFRLVTIPKAEQAGIEISLKDIYLGPEKDAGKKPLPHCTGTLIGWGKVLARHIPGETIEQKLEINNPFPAERRSVCILTLDNGRGFRQEYSFPVTLKPGMNQFTFPVKLPPRNGVFRLSGAVEGTPFLRRSCFAVFPAAKVHRGELPIDHGVNGVTYSDKAFLEPVLCAYSEIGITCVRPWDTGDYFRWPKFEPEAGKFDWRDCDAMVDTSAKYGIEIMPVVGGMFFMKGGHSVPLHLKTRGRIGQSLYSDRPALFPADSDWRQMVRTMATRYKGRIRCYEINNEPNLFLRTADEYLPYLKSAYEELKKADPSCTVVGVCVTGDYDRNILTYVEKALQLDAAKYMDVMSFHPYNNLYEESRASGEVVMRDIRRLMQKYSGKCLPLWNTELYYLNPACTGGSDHLNGPVFHPGWLVRRLVLDAASQVAYGMPLHGSAFIASGIDFHYLKERKGTFFSPSRILNEKAVVSAVFANTLRGTKFAGRIIDNAGFLRGYLFESKTKAVAVCFTPAAPEETKEFVSIPGKTFDVFGNPAPGIAVSALPSYVSAKDRKALAAVLKNYGRCDWSTVRPEGLKVARRPLPVPPPRIDVSGFPGKVRLAPAKSSRGTTMKTVNANWLKEDRVYLVTTQEAPPLSDNWQYVSSEFTAQTSGKVSVLLMGSYASKAEERQPVLFANVTVNGKPVEFRVSGKARRIPGGGPDGKNDAFLVNHDNPAAGSLPVEAGKVYLIEGKAKSGIKLKNKMNSSTGKENPMNLKKMLAASTIAASALIGAQEVANFQFSGADGVKGWRQTQKVELIPEAKSLTLVSKGSDSKIYRTISLEPGRYAVSATGRELSVQIQRDWSSKSVVFQDKLDGEQTTSVKKLKLEQGGNLILCVQTFSKGSIVSLKISKIKK